MELDENETNKKKIALKTEKKDVYFREFKVFELIYL